MPLDFKGPRANYANLFGQAGGQMGGLLSGAIGGNKNPSNPPPPNAPTQAMYAQNVLGENLGDLEEEGGGWMNKFNQGFSDYFGGGQSYNTLPGTSANFGIGNVGINNNYNEPVNDYFKPDYTGGGFGNQLSQAWQNRGK